MSTESYDTFLTESMSFLTRLTLSKNPSMNPPCCCPLNPPPASSLMSIAISNGARSLADLPPVSSLSRSFILNRRAPAPPGAQVTCGKNRPGWALRPPVHRSEQEKYTSEISACYIFNSLLPESLSLSLQTCPAEANEDRDSKHKQCTKCSAPGLVRPSRGEKHEGRGRRR